MKQLMQTLRPKEQSKNFYIVGIRNSYDQVFQTQKYESKFQAC